MKTLRIWAILGARAGDNNQVLALAEALGRPFEVKPLDYNALHGFGPSLLGRSLVSLTKDARWQVTAEPPPDLTISAGHRSVPAVRALRERSASRMRSIHVGFPRVSPGQFDLVIATPQYPVPDHPNLLRVPFALTRAVTAPADPQDEKLLADMPSPRRLLIVGGPTLYWQLDGAALLGVLAGMIGEAGMQGGSVIVTTSPRTPARVCDAIRRALDAHDVPSLLAAPGHPPSYAGLLKAADSIRVTADSVAMVSDAIWTGKPLALVPIVKSTLGRAAMALMDRLRPAERLYPRDLRFFWRTLEEIGVTDQLSRPRVSADEQLNTIMRRAAPIVGVAGHQIDLTKKNGGRGKD